MMKFVVREEHKDGGAKFCSAEEAIEACVAWRLATEVRCEVFIDLPSHPLHGCQSLAHTLEADMRWARLSNRIDDLEAQGFKAPD